MSFQFPKKVKSSVLIPVALWQKASAVHVLHSLEEEKEILYLSEMF